MELQCWCHPQLYPNGCCPGCQSVSPGWLMCALLLRGSASVPASRSASCLGFCPLLTSITSGCVAVAILGKE